MLLAKIEWAGRNGLQYSLFGATVQLSLLLEASIKIHVLKYHCFHYLFLRG